MKRQRLVGFAAVLLLSLFSLAANDGDPRTRLRRITPVGAGVAKQASAPRFSQLQDYFFDANPGLIHALESLKRARGLKEKHFGVTYVAAPAGSGKSFLFGTFAKQMADSIYKIDLGKLKGKQVPTHLVTDLQAILAPEAELSSSLRGFGKDGDPARIQNSPTLAELFRVFEHDLVKKPRAFLILDSLDEIHPLSAVSVLERVDEYLAAEEKRNPDGFVHVFVVGRPEAFTMYYRDSHPEKKPAVHEMKLPRYESLADLKVAVESSRAYAKRTARDADATVTLVSRHPWAAESVHLLYILGELVDGSAAEFVESRAGERFMKDRLFARMLRRNQASLDMPNFKSDFYVRLLEEIASRYTDVDADGFFRVNWSDTIEVECDLRGKPVKRSFMVTNVLNRSGVAYLEPGNFQKPRYRFLPSWLHEHLVYRQHDHARHSSR